MMEVRDTVIKLFGKDISLPENGKIHYAGESSATFDREIPSSNHDCILIKMNKTCLEAKKVNRVGEENTQKDNHLPEESTNSKAFSAENDEEIATLSIPNTETEQKYTTNSEKKTLKKPNKILPCPRCNSMDTKFCYYNNYNVNQPRHFCKSCQRYWTSGGSMRNVPAGSGRRKNKNHSAYYLHTHTTASDEALEVARVNGILGPNFKPNGTVLSFDSGSQLCESAASIFSLAEKKVPNGIQNGIYKLEQGILVPRKGEENRNNFSIRSSVKNSNPMVEGARNGIQEPRMQNLHGFPPQFPYLPGVPWPYPWNCAVPVSGIQNPVNPAPYWNCNVLGAWSNPWLSPSCTSNQTAPKSGLSSPALGKHSREGELLNRTANPKLEEKTCERPILVSEVLRIDGPDEATKSPICRGELFIGFKAKGDEKKHVNTVTSPVLQANPAAMSRFISFQERA